MNCLDIITRAMRRIGVLASGELPQVTETQDALETLKGIYRRLISEGAFGVITTVADITNPQPGQRLHVDDMAVIELPDTAPTNSIIILIDRTRNVVEELVFDDRTASWISIDSLETTSTAPLATRDPNGLASYLAIELADEYGQQPSEITVRNAARWQTAITHDYSAPDLPDPDAAARYF